MRPCPRRHGRRSARTGLFQDRASVVEPVLQHAGVVGMAGPQPRQRCIASPLASSSAASTGSGAITCSHLGHRCCRSRWRSGCPVTPWRSPPIRSPRRPRTSSARPAVAQASAASCSAMSADVTSTPATIPSTSATRARPCDSPGGDPAQHGSQLFHGAPSAPNPADRGHSYEKVGPTTRMAATEDSAGLRGSDAAFGDETGKLRLSWASPTTRRAVAGSADNPPTTNASFRSPPPL